MVHDILAEGFFQESGTFERRSRLAQRVRNFLQPHRAIGIAHKRFVQFQLFIHAFQAGGDERCKGQIGIDIRAADAAFDANALGTFAAKAKTAVRLSWLHMILVGAKVPA
ncbi:hypothetical protein DO75_2186 [Brucella abortus]|nr:hypothetical protein DO75_2186 [Brucella abortus]